jgi:hypothetical protein
VRDYPVTLDKLLKEMPEPQWAPRKT